MSVEAQFVVFESAAADGLLTHGKDPLALLEELEQLAATEGYSDIHSFISSYLQFGDQS
jgi:hypothetical protein